MDKAIVSDYMTTDIKYIFVHQSVQEALALMIKYQVSCLPVLAPRHRLAGLISQSDILKLYLANRSAHELTIQGDDIMLATGELPTLPVKQIMSRKVFSVSPYTTIEEAGEMMLKYNVRRLLVLEHGYLIGVLSQIDLLHPLPLSA